MPGSGVCSAHDALLGVWGQGKADAAVQAARVSVALTLREGWGIGKGLLSMFIVQGPFLFTPPSRSPEAPENLGKPARGSCTWAKLPKLPGQWQHTGVQHAVPRDTQRPELSFSPCDD